MRLLAALTVLVIVLAGCSARSAGSKAGAGDECKPTQEGSFVFGLVMDPAKSPLAAAHVVARATGVQHEIADDTDSRGCYAIALAVGQYHDVEASKAGYKAHKSDILALNEGEKRKLNFELERA